MTEIKADSVLVFWSLSEWSDREKLVSGLTPLGLTAYAPSARTPYAALKSALDHVYKEKHYLVRALEDRDGLLVVEERRGKTSNLFLDVVCVKLEEVEGLGPRLRFQGSTCRSGVIEEAFRQQLGLVHQAQVGKSLVELISSFHGTSLRPRGGLYWIPPAKLVEWRVAKTVFEGSAAMGGASALYSLTTRWDAEACRAVRDAITREVSAEASGLLEDIQGSDLSVRALEARKARATELRDRVKEYESILSLSLQDLYVALDQVDAAKGMSTLMLSAAQVLESQSI